MSLDRSDLDTSTEGAAKIVSILSGISFVTEVYLNGSRSPNAVRPPREDSDWDFICVTNRDFKTRYQMRRISESYGFHADAIFINSSQLEHYKQAVMIYPNDEHGVLK